MAKQSPNQHLPAEFIDENGQHMRRKKSTVDEYDDVGAPLSERPVVVKRADKFLMSVMCDGSEGSRVFCLWGAMTGEHTLETVAEHARETGHVVHLVEAVSITVEPAPNPTASIRKSQNFHE